MRELGGPRFTLDEAKRVGLRAFWLAPGLAYELMWDDRLASGIWHHEFDGPGHTAFWRLVQDIEIPEDGWFHWPPCACPLCVAESE